MPRFIVQETCFGFRNARWKEGQEVFVDEGEVKNLPRDKDGNIRHFVSPDKFVPHTVDGGRSPVNPDGSGGKLNLKRATQIAMAPATQDTTGGISAPIAPASVRGAADVPEGSMPPAPAPRRAGRPKK